MCFHLTSNVMLSAFSLFLLQFFTGLAQYNRCGWLAGTHRDVFCVAAVGPAGRLCVCVCVHASVCVLMCSVTLPLRLPATFCLQSLIPRGTATHKKDGDAHITSISLWHFVFLLVEFWFLFSFFFSIFQFPTKNQVTSLSCAFWQHDGMLWLMNQLPSNLVFSVSLFVYFFFFLLALLLLNLWWVNHF